MVLTRTVNWPALIYLIVRIVVVLHFAADILRLIVLQPKMSADLSYKCSPPTKKDRTMSTTYSVRALVLASSLALLCSLGLWASAVEAWCGIGPFPATGQTTSFPADTQAGPGRAVPDDGAVQAGGALSYVDNGDGTITDLNTGLMWEKKSLDGTEHDALEEFPWSSTTLATIWDWLAGLNATAFAGYTDWRIPNAKELQSIIDYGRFSPTVDSAFNNNVMVGCTVFQCSVSALKPYWTSTSVQTPDAVGTLEVDFVDGRVIFESKSIPRKVRAVRDGCLP